MRYKASSRVLKLSNDYHCLNEVFENLEDDKVTLHSCLLVNRLWCEVSVRILWRKIWNYGTLISCLPNESKELLRKNEIFISTPSNHYCLIMQHSAKFFQLIGLTDWFSPL